MKIQSTQRIASSVELNLRQQEATNAVKLKGGTKQTAMQMKGLSSEIHNIIEADVVYGMEGIKYDSVKGELSSLYRSPKPWYVLRWNFCELGRSLFLSWKGMMEQAITGENYQTKIGKSDWLIVLGAWESHAQGEVTSKKALDWEKII